jgi:hypothetical protein
MAKNTKPIGYEYLRSKYQIQSPQHYRASYISDKWRQEVHSENDRQEHYYPPTYDPGTNLGDHTDFALKYEGLDLCLLVGLFETLDRSELTAVIQEKPHGQYRRKLWYLFEFLMDEKLPIPDLKSGNYVPLADEDIYFTNVATRSPRHRIQMNLFGSRHFCPLIRKTAKILAYQKKHLNQLASNTIQAYPPELLARAVSYLYTKETKASFQIEHEQPDHNRSEKFIYLLRQAHKKSFLDKTSLINLQNTIVDSRFGATDYRDFQNYVGETHGFGKERIHYICPKPEDVSDLMTGLLDSSQQMIEAEFDPVLFSAVIAFGFVFIHPFEDGNGRIHRFLIHNILALYHYTPEGVIFPVSSSMLQQMRKYDETLESFSYPRLALTDYNLDAHGTMQVRGSTKRFYSCTDFTFICEQLYEFVEDTVLNQLPEELNFLARYDLTKKAMRNIVDMPDRLIDLFIRICAGNNGKMSKAKRQSHFSKLTDDEISRLEQAFANNQKI